MSPEILVHLRLQNSGDVNLSQDAEAFRFQGVLHPNSHRVEVPVVLRVML